MPAFTNGASMTVAWCFRRNRPGASPARPDFAAPSGSSLFPRPSVVRARRMSRPRLPSRPSPGPPSGALRLVLNARNSRCPRHQRLAPSRWLPAPRRTSRLTRHFRYSRHSRIVSPTPSGARPSGARRHPFSAVASPCRSALFPPRAVSFLLRADLVRVSVGARGGVPVRNRWARRGLRRARNKA